MGQGITARDLSERGNKGGNKGTFFWGNKGTFFLLDGDKGGQAGTRGQGTRGQVPCPRGVLEEERNRSRDGLFAE